MSKYWYNQQGEKVYIKKADSKYLFNALNHFRRQLGLLSNTTLAYLYLPEPNGEMAQDCVDREFNNLLEAEGETARLCEAIEKELDNRHYGEEFLV